MTTTVKFKSIDMLDTALENIKIRADHNNKSKNRDPRLTRVLIDARNIIKTTKAMIIYGGKVNMDVQLFDIVNRYQEKPQLDKDAEEDGEDA